MSRDQILSFYNVCKEMLLNANTMKEINNQIDSRGYYSKNLNKTNDQNKYLTQENLSLKNMLDVIRFNIDYITNLKFYQVVVPNKVHHNQTKKLKAIMENRKMEEGFVLDCVYTSLQKKPEYNSLLDKNCEYFFKNERKKMFLTKAGFLNKKGMVLKDPGFLNLPKRKNNRMNFLKGNDKFDFFSFYMNRHYTELFSG